jgi:hypothetical protein
LLVVGCWLLVVGCWLLVWVQVCRDARDGERLVAAVRFRQVLVRPVPVLEVVVPIGW